MKSLSFLVLTTFSLQVGCAQEDKKEAPAPLKALLVTGGVSHDYAIRKQIVTRGISERVNRVIEWRTVFEGEGESDEKISLFEGSGWADGYDIVVHDYCFPRVRDEAFVSRILAPHQKGTPAVLIHGTLHSFKGTTAEWAAFSGVQTIQHDSESSLEIITDSKSPIVDGLESWSAPYEQLYLVNDLLPSTEVLATAKRRFGENEHPVVWTNRFEEAQTKVFATSLGNSLETMSSKPFLDTLTKGFLWALGEEGKEIYKEVPEAQTLKSISLPKREPLSLAIGGHSLPFQSAAGLSANGMSHTGNAELATDGLKETAWIADVPGPASWTGRLLRPTPIAALAVYWTGSIPAEYTIETSENGIDWIPAPSSQESGPQSESSISVYDLSVESASWIRVSVQRGVPFGSVGIREIAVFETWDNLPSGLLALIDTPKRSVLLSLNEDGAAADFRISPEWRRIGEQVISQNSKPRELIVTGDRKGFLFTVSDEQNPRAEVIHFWEEEGEIHSRSFLSDLPVSSAIAWDGEWLYVIEQNHLWGYRDTNEDQVADEKFEVGEIFFPLSEEAPLEVAYSTMRVGADGWLYVNWRSPHPVEVYTNEGSIPFLVPSSGLVRMARDGSGFEIPDAYGLKAAKMPPKNLDGIAEIPGLLHFGAAEDSMVWYVSENTSAGEIRIGLLASKTPEVIPSLDSLNVDELIRELALGNPIRRREIQWELMRRKLVSAKSLRKVIADATSDSEAERGALRVLNQVESKSLPPEILSLTKSDKADRRAFGFELLGLHREGKNHAALSRITKETEPLVSVAILQAILRSGSDAPGLDRLVLKMVSHENEALSEAAKSFLLRRENSSICFAFLDDEELREHWGAAFHVLAEIYKQSVAEEIVLRLEKTTSADFRKHGLEALTRLYFKGGKVGETWEGTPIADLMLKASLVDHRVDRASLIDRMLSAGIPVDEATLLELGKENIPFEALAVSRLDPEALSPETVEWLREITGDRSRDQGQKLAALAKLLPSLKGDVLRGAFSTIAEASKESPAIVAETALKESWFSNSELEDLSSWLCERYRSGNSTEMELARETLLLIAQNQSLPGGQLAEIKATLDLKRIPGSNEEGDSLVGRSYEEIEALIVPFSGDRNLGENWFRVHGCAHCHNIEGEGPAIGPDLMLSDVSDSVPDLLEAIFDASAHVAESYQLEVFERKDGVRITGVVQHRDEDGIHLRDIAGNHLRVDSETLHRSWASSESMMPSLARDEIEIEELADLIAFLKYLKIPSFTQAGSQ